MANSANIPAVPPAPKEPAPERGFTIRAAEVADAPALIELRKQIFAETNFMLWEPDEFRESADDERARLQRLAAAHNSAAFIAVADGQLVAFLNAFGASPRRLRHASTLALGVLQACWGRGIAAALLDAVIAWSETEGLVRLDLTVHVTNARALALYRRAGFEIEGTRRKSLLLGNEFVDEYLMSRLNIAERTATR